MAEGVPYTLLNKVAGNKQASNILNFAGYLSTKTVSHKACIRWTKEDMDEAKTYLHWGLKTNRRLHRVLFFLSTHGYIRIGEDEAGTQFLHVDFTI